MNTIAAATTRPLAAGAALVAALLLATPLDAQEPADSAEGPIPAFTHLRHVSETFRGTPENRGLLPTAVAEAEIAHQHATLALRDPTDIDAMRRHTRHVLHALDPSAEESGPGLGYGAVRAAERTAHYIALAATSVGATDAIETHATHIGTASRSAMAKGDEALEIAREIVQPEPEPADTTEAADTARAEGAVEEEPDEEEADEEEAAESPEPLTAAEIEALLTEIVSLTEAMLNGVDADGDGRIGWQEGEGGLAQAARHLELLQRAEGIGGP